MNLVTWLEVLLNLGVGMYAGEKSLAFLVEQLTRCLGHNDTPQTVPLSWFSTFLAEPYAHPLAPVCQILAIARDNCLRGSGPPGP